LLGRGNLGGDVELAEQREGAVYMPVRGVEVRSGEICLAERSLSARIGYWTEGTGLSHGVQPANAPYTLKTTAGTVYIGYSPSTGAHFYGKIRSIRFDPGSKGN
jgi:hypothetical protein